MVPVTGIDLSVETLKKMALHPNIVGVKDKDVSMPPCDGRAHLIRFSDANEKIAFFNFRRFCSDFVVVVSDGKTRGVGPGNARPELPSGRRFGQLSVGRHARR